MSRGRVAHNRRGRGFTLIELVIVIMILGILAGVAAPRVFDASRDGEAAAILTNVNVILDAVELYTSINGQLPDNTSSGSVPADIAPDYVPEWLFTRPTVTGKPYDWDGPGTTAGQYGVAIDYSDGTQAHTTALYARLEAMGDDGDVATGWIRASGAKIIFFYADK